MTLEKNDGDKKRKVRIRNQDGTIGYVSANKLCREPIIQPVLDEELQARIEWVYREIKPIFQEETPEYCPLEQFEITFMRSSEPEKDITVWENIVKAFYVAREYFKKNGMETDKLIFRILMFHLADALTREERERDDVKLIQKVYYDISNLGLNNNGID